MLLYPHEKTQCNKTFPAYCFHSLPFQTTFVHILTVGLGFVSVALSAGKFSFLLLLAGNEGMFYCPLKEHCVTLLQNVHGSLAPDALLSIKHIESTECLPYSSPEGV